VFLSAKVDRQLSARRVRISHGETDRRRNVDAGQDLAVSYGNTSIPCKSENDAKLLARELVKKGHQVRAETLEGQSPVRIIAHYQIFEWLAES
jgi:hypothetical protein